MEEIAILIDYNGLIRMVGGIFYSVIVGIVFGAGWSPCIRPIFGAII